MPSTMTLRAMNLRVFQGKPIPHVLFQPRFEPWFAWQRRFGTLPDEMWAAGLRASFDRLGASMRYVHYVTGMPDPVHLEYDSGVTIRHIDSPTERVRVYETPYGEMVEREQLTIDEEWREVGFPVKGPEDLRKLRWLCGHMHWSFSRADFEQGSEFVGDRGEPQFWLPKSPYQALAQTWMKLQDLIFALHDCPADVEDTMRAIDEAYDPLYAGILDYGQVKIVNFGENIHDHLLSPRYFERYLIPWYSKRSSQLRQAGIFSHVHIDGYFHTLLKYLKDLPVDGLEALTPLPQGDVSLEEIKEHIGDKVLLDGIPAVFFLSTYSREQLLACVDRLVSLFAPRLILGVSDEVPQGAEAVEAFARLEMVADRCRKNESTGP